MTVANLLGWALISFGLAALSEGYHAFRQRADRLPKPLRAWWIAGLIWALGLLSIEAGLALQSSCLAT